ncbi:CopG family ribbon-helix-helix protein [Jiella marina]|uniref:CopG family ribbon-helix-helix protein n=1 Tax=Jiella sp. LLJ827 TaxID=2917712 RepID=UPI0021010D43|nr:hypothetical protein [Jiella sp. LLJ827]MCQ0988523.1 hypothetical protein [Jiella sp. LLJ827]
MGTLDLSLDLDDAVLAEFDDEARRRSLSPASLAEEAIGAYLEAAKRRRTVITEAVREADRGVFVSREAVDRWVDSWQDGEPGEPPKANIFPQR